MQTPAYAEQPQDDSVERSPQQVDFAAGSQQLACASDWQHSSRVGVFGGSAAEAAVCRRDVVDPVRVCPVVLEFWFGTFVIVALRQC